MKRRLAELLERDKALEQPGILKTLLAVRDDDKRKIKNPEELFREGFSILLLLYPVSIANMSLDFTFAGQGTTAAALISIIYDLGLHPDWQYRISCDISNAPVPHAHPLLWKLPSLQAFVYESLRLSPPLPASFERVIATGAEHNIPGIQAPLPQGTRVGTNMYVLMRSKEIYGDDAEAFKPERWINADNEHRKAMEDAWAVFGRGSRACMGREVALMLMSIVVAKVWILNPL